MEGTAALNSEAVEARNRSAVLETRDGVGGVGVVGAVEATAWVQGWT